MTTQALDKNTLYLIYDDECPLCRSSAHGFDPDLGIIVIYNDQYYFGADAAHFLALLTSSYSKLNAITAFVFRVKIFARLLYPVVKSIRRILLKIKGVSAIEQNDGLPLFAKVLGNDWQQLSPLMKKRFGNRPYSNDILLVHGTMTIKGSRWMRLIKPFLKMSGAVIQHDGENIPVTVTFKSDFNSSKYWFDRELKFL